MPSDDQAELNGLGAEGGAAAVGYAAVLGDLVASREATPQVFDRVREALERTNAEIRGVQPLQATIGDEFQGVYAGLGPALNATLLVRLLLHDVIEVRFGLGWGDLTRWDAERAPFEQDGPAWWAAREALEAVDRQDRGVGMPAGWRTAVRFAAGSGTPPAGPGTPPAGSGTPPADGDEGAELGERPTGGQTSPLPGLQPARHLDVPIDASLEGLVMLRDQILSRLDDRDVGLVLALLDGATVTQAAGRVRISQQAASRRLRSNGGYALVRSWRLLEGEG